MKQASFLPREDTWHGGEQVTGRRKSARPFSPRCAVHVTMRAPQARGRSSMLISPKRERLAGIIGECARKYGVRVHRHANVGNHLHFLIRARTRSAFQGFLREVAGRIAMLMTGAAKGRPRKFWVGLAWSRLVSWGREFRAVQEYVIANLFEAEGLLSAKAKRARTYRFSHSRTAAPE